MSKDRAPEINVTPLIDVLLVLLIIFMVVAPVRPSQFETKVPSRHHPGCRDPFDPIPIVVSVETTGTISIDGSSTSLGDLEPLLRDRLADRTEHSVILRAPTGVPYRDVVEVIDRIKGAGAEPIGLQVDLLDV